MANAKVTWTSSHTFIGEDSTKHSVVMSSKEDGIGMKASELLLVALGGCSSYDVVSILEKRKKNLRKLQVALTAEQDEEAPWTFRKIHMVYTASGDGLEAKDLEKAIELSEGKYCSVAATLRGEAEITWEHILEE